MPVFVHYRVVLAASLFLGLAPAALAQSNPGYFIPPTHNSEPAVSSAPKTHVSTPSQATPVKAPPIPQLPALPKAAPPPVAVIGVLSVPEVLQKSTAAQGVQTVIQQRQADLGKDAQAARAKIQAEQAQIEATRSTLTDSALEAKEQALRAEIASTQKKFAERNQAIQNSGQAALGQIESELIGIIRQEAEAHGMNLVLHREQVALNVSAFDITAEVAAQLNKLMPSVTVPPSVVTPGMAITQPDNGDGTPGQ